MTAKKLHKQLRELADGLDMLHKALLSAERPNTKGNLKQDKHFATVAIGCTVSELSWLCAKLSKDGIQP